MGLLRSISNRLTNNEETDQEARLKNPSYMAGKRYQSESKPFTMDVNKKYPIYTLIPNDIEARKEYVEILEYDEDGNDCSKGYEYLVPYKLHPFDAYASEVDASYLLDESLTDGDIGVYNGTQPFIVIEYAEDINGYKPILYGNQIENSLRRVRHTLLRYRYEYVTDKVYHVGYLFYKNTEEEREHRFHEVAMEIPRLKLSTSLKYQMLDYLETVAASLKIVS